MLSAHSQKNSPFSHPSSFDYSQFDQVSFQKTCSDCEIVNEIIILAKSPEPNLKKLLMSELGSLKKSHCKTYKKFNLKFYKLLKHSNLHLTSKQKFILKLNYLLLFLNYQNNMPQNTHHLKKLYAVSKSGRRMYFNDIIDSGGSKNVYLAKYNSKKYVLKWVTSDHRTITEEIDILLKLYNMNVPLYKFYTNYTFWNKPILCMEYLKPLNGKENEFKVGICILKILKKLHTFGIHNDIKIDNIMKNNKNIYLIDYGGVTTERKKHGFLRRCWTNKWSSQPKARNQLTTAKNDFLELGFTMYGLQLLRKGISLTSQNIKNVKNKYIQRYMSKVNRIDEKQINKNIYSVLIKLLYNFSKSRKSL